MLKIGDFSKKTGIPIKTLRYYDEIDLLKPSHTETFTLYRYYIESQIYDALKIKELKKLDLSLEQIKDYIKTNDIKIITKKRSELEMKINKIEDFISDEYKKYMIYEANYNKYIENHGLFNSKCPQALEVRDGNAKYFVIELNEESIDDFVIYINDENWITINRNKFLDDDYIDLIFNYLVKKDYKFIKTYIPIENNNIISHIEKKFKISTKQIVKQGEYEYIKYIINI